MVLGKTRRRILAAVLFCAALAVVHACGTVKAAGDYTVSGTTLVLNPSVPVETGFKRALQYITDHKKEGVTYTIKLPAGEYEQGSEIILSPGVKVDLTGVTLKYTKKTGNMILLSHTDESGKNTVQYGQKGKITITGGTFHGNDVNSSSLVRMAHGTDITFDGCTFSGGGCAHQMEVAAINGLTVKNCTFRDMKGNGTDEKQEALQLDIPCSSYIFSGVELDGTPMKNVTVSGCTFQNVPRGLGSHSMLVGVYHENIKILNNTFENVDGECIIALNYRNCTIKANKIKNCGAGILFQNFKPGARAVYTTVNDGKTVKKGKIDNNVKTVISGNDITLSAKKHADERVGIKIYGFNLKKDTRATGKGSSDLIPKGNYSVKNITVSGNRIKTCGHGIHLMDASNAVVKGNTIENIKQGSEKDGIFAEFACKNLSIQKNTVKKAARYGIFLQHKTTAKTVSDNKILGSCGKYGIGLYDNSKVIHGITGNTIENSKSNAIFLNHGCSAESINKNTVKKSGGTGIGLYDKCTVSSGITGNKIDGCKSHGISVSLKCHTKKISGNTIRNVSAYPVVINTSSKKKITVSKNKITAEKGKDKIHIINGVVKK